MTGTAALPAVFDDSAAGWERALYAFLSEKQRRSGSQRTLDSYYRMLQHFFRRLGKTPDQVTSQDVFAFAHGKGISGREPSGITIGARLSCLSSFFKFLIRMDIVKANPCDAVERPRTQPSPPRGLSADQVKRLLDVIPDTVNGRSGTGQKGVKYFYYTCGNKDCEIRIRSEEAEHAVIERLRTLADRPDIMSALVEKTNRGIKRGIPALKKRRRAIKTRLDEGKSRAGKVLTDFAANSHGFARELVDEMLEETANQRAELKAGLTEVEWQIEAAGRATVSERAVMAALSDFSAVYECLKPFERKELVKLIVHRLEITDREIALEVYGMPNIKIGETEATRGPSRFGPPMRLLGQDLNLQQYG